MNLLAQLAIKHGTDKWGHHFYCDIYQQYFDKLKDQPITLLEMGFGGYEFPDRGGGSMKMWAEYFTNPAAKLFVSDIYDKNLDGFDSRIKFVKDNAESPFLIFLAKKLLFDIIIDDASHHNKLVINGFKELFPSLKSGGIYVVEDAHASYWDVPAHEGTLNLQGQPTTSSMNYFKYLADGLNREHIPTEKFPDFIQDIYSIHFYEKMIFILKK